MYRFNELRVFEEHGTRKAKIYHKEKEAAPARYWPVCRAEMGLQLLRSHWLMNTVTHPNFCEKFKIKSITTFRRSVTFVFKLVWLV